MGGNGFRFTHAMMFVGLDVEHVFDPSGLGRHSRSGLFVPIIAPTLLIVDT